MLRTDLAEWSDRKIEVVDKKQKEENICGMIKQEVIPM